MLLFGDLFLFSFVQSLYRKHTDDVVQTQQLFMECLSPVKGDIERFILFLTRNREDAKELMAETVARCFEHFDAVRHKQAFKSYAMTTARRLFYEHQKKKNREIHITTEELDTIFDAGISPEHSMEASLLYKAIGTLPDMQQEAIILTEIMGYSLKETATIQRSTVAAVKVRMYRAKKSLYVLLSDEYSHKH